MILLSRPRSCCLASVSWSCGGRRWNECVLRRCPDAMVWSEVRGNEKEIKLAKRRQLLPKKSEERRDQAETDGVRVRRCRLRMLMACMSTRR